MRISYIFVPHKIGIRLLGIMENPANSFPARPLGRLLPPLLYLEPDERIRVVQHPLEVNRDLAAGQRQRPHRIEPDARVFILQCLDKGIDRLLPSKAPRCPCRRGLHSPHFVPQNFDEVQRVQGLVADAVEIAGGLVCRGDLVLPAPSR